MEDFLLKLSKVISPIFLKKTNSVSEKTHIFYYVRTLQIDLEKQENPHSFPKNLRDYSTSQTHLIENRLCFLGLSITL